MTASAKKYESQRLHERHRKFLAAEASMRQGEVQMAVAQILRGEIVKKPKRGGK